MTLANLGIFVAFWSPSRRRFYARTRTTCKIADLSDLFRPARGKAALPADAVYVGCYAGPFSSETLLEDVEQAAMLVGAAPDPLLAQVG